MLWNFSITPLCSMCATESSWDRIGSLRSGSKVCVHGICMCLCVLHSLWAHRHQTCLIQTVSLGRKLHCCAWAVSHHRLQSNTCHVGWIHQCRPIEVHPETTRTSTNHRQIPEDRFSTRLQFWKLRRKIMLSRHIKNSTYYHAV